jgi:hypothetical protein
MDINLLIGIVGLVLSVGSLIYAVYVRNVSNLEKKLTYEVIPPVSVAEVIKGSGNYSLRVVYERPDNKPLYIENAYMQLLRFANFGKIPITKGDLAKTDKLRIEIQEGSVLDISLSSVTRSACHIKLGKPTKVGNTVVAEIDFEFLDFLDGGLIQILSDTDRLKTTLRGTVVGMSEGIREKTIGSEPVEVPNWGCAIGVLIEIGALALVPFIYQRIIGSWNNIWVLALPIAALVGPFMLFYLIMTVFSLRDKSRFPKRLLAPQWYRVGSGWYFPAPKARFERENARLIAEIEELKAKLENTEKK